MHFRWATELKDDKIMMYWEMISVFEVTCVSRMGVNTCKLIHQDISHLFWSNDTNAILMSLERKYDCDLRQIHIRNYIGTYAAGAQYKSMDTLVRISVINYIYPVSKVTLKSSKMLLILQKYRFLSNMLGLELLNNGKYQFAAVAFMILSSSVILMSFANVIVSADKVNEDAINSFIASIACIMAFVYTAHMLINRMRFRAIEIELQDIVNESKCQLGEKSLANCEWNNNGWCFPKESKETEMINCTWNKRRSSHLTWKLLHGPHFVWVHREQPHLHLLHFLGAWETTHWIHGFFISNFGKSSILPELSQFQSTVFFVVRRTPFPVNTTWRCIAMAFFQMGPIFYAPLIYCTILSLFAGLVLYASAILTDITSIFDRIDRLVKSKDIIVDELTVLSHFREAIDLHAQLYRQFSVQFFLLFLFVKPDYSIAVGRSDWRMWWMWQFLVQ